MRQGENPRGFRGAVPGTFSGGQGRGDPADPAAARAGWTYEKSGARAVCLEYSAQDGAWSPVKNSAVQNQAAAWKSARKGGWGKAEHPSASQLAFSGAFRLFQCVRVCTCVCAHAHVHLCVCACVHAWVCAYVQVYLYRGVCVCVCLCTCMHVCLCTAVYMYVSV